MRAPSDRWVVLGGVSGIFGVGGWVRVFSNTEPREGILAYSAWFLKSSDGWEERRLEQGRAHGKGVVAKLEGSADRDDARFLMGRQIAVPRSALPAPGEGEFYWADLIGLGVRSDDGREFGVVDGFMETGSNDVLVVKGQRERLIPFIMNDVVKAVDLDSGLVIVDWDADF